MINIEFTEEEKQALHYERYHHPHPKIQRRMEALWLKSQGESHKKIAQLTGMTLNTVTNHIKEYKAGGIERLKQLHYHPAGSELDKHIQSVEQDFKQRPPATIKEAMGRIEKLTGLKRSEVQIGACLKRMGLTRRKIGMVPAQADIQRQEEFKKKLCNQDSMRLKQENGPSYLWMPRILS